MSTTAFHRLPAPLRDWFHPAPDSVVADLLRRGKSPWTDAVHLLWSSWIFVTPLFGTGYTGRWMLLTLLSYPVFLLLYARTLLAPCRIAWRSALGMIVLSLVLLPFYPSGISYYVFGCVMLRTRSTLGRYLLRLLAINVVFVVLAWRIGYPWQVWVSLPVMTMVIGVIMHVERIAHEADAALKLSHDEVRRLAATAERERIGRDLHDLLGHTLSLVAIKSELAKRLALAEPARAQREMAEVERVARHALTEVRAAVTGMRHSDLAAELVSARLMLEASGVALEGELPDGLALPEQIEAPLALVMREAATNIHRHARATRASVAFSINGNGIDMQIGDNGRGGLAAHGNGVSGMRERVRALGGTLSIDSPPRRGTVLSIRVPLAARAPTAAPVQAAAADTARLPAAGSAA
jgi:two-component system sensor histidine kinase DesK